VRNIELPYPLVDADRGYQKTPGVPWQHRTPCRRCSPRSR
jgi:hypothetical protein